MLLCVCYLKLLGDLCSEVDSFFIFLMIQADFFVTYILTNGLSGFSLEILQLGLLSWDALKSCTFSRGRDKNPYLYSLPYFRVIPLVSVSVLIGMVYAVVAPLLLPFLIGYFCLGYAVFINQVAFLNSAHPSSLSFHINMWLAAWLQTLTCFTLLFLLFVFFNNLFRHCSTSPLPSFPSRNCVVFLLTTFETLYFITN